MAIEDGRLVAGYTLRVLRQRMTPRQRARFDREVPFRIDDDADARVA